MRIINIIYKLYDEKFIVDGVDTPNKHQYMRVLGAAIFAAFPNAFVNVSITTSPKDENWLLVQAREGHKLSDVEEERIAKAVVELDVELFNLICKAKNS